MTEALMSAAMFSSPLGATQPDDDFLPLFPRIRERTSLPAPPPSLSLRSLFLSLSLTAPHFFLLFSDTFALEGRYYYEFLPRGAPDRPTL